MIARGLRIAVALAVMVGLTGLARAADEAGAPSRTVRQVKVQPLDAFAGDTGDVLALVSIKAGDVFDQGRLNQDVRALEDTQRFSLVNVKVEPMTDGVRIIYEISRRYRFVGPVALVGVDYFSDSKVEDWLDLRDGAPVDEQVLTVKCNKVRDEYLKRYFPKTDVRAVLEPTARASGQARVHVTVVEGPRIKPDSYLFHGNQALPAKELRATFGERPWWDPRGWFTTNPYSEQQLEDARQHALDAYLDAGYLDARISAARFEQIDPKHAKVVFDVEEGTRYVIGGVIVTGVKLFPEADVLRAATAVLKTGTVAGRKTIQDASKTVRDYYGSRGYVDTVVRPNPVPVAANAGQVTIRLDVHEGVLVSVRNIVIRGNTRTMDKVIRREVPVSPGQIMDEVRIERSENKLKNLGLFDSVRHYSEPNDGESTNRDLVFEVKEGQTGNFMIGAGYSSVDKIVGYLELQQKNFDILNWPSFTGAGQKARLGVEVGQKEQAYEVGWTEPWFLDKPMALTVDLYRRKNDYDEYDVTRMGGDVGITYPIAIGSLGVKYTLEQIRLNNLLAGDFFFMDDPTQLYRFTDEPDSAVNSAVQLSWDYDTRNHVFVPTRGTQANVFGELAGAPFGGEDDIFHSGANYRHWFGLWWKHVLSVRARVETVSSYGNKASTQENVPIYDRLFLGGGRTIRGVRYRDVGPKVTNAGDDHPIGGDTLGMVSAEYTIPIFEAVRLAFFSDAGSLHTKDYDYADLLKDYSWTYGAGLRIDIPGFPIRLDYGLPIHRDSGTRREPLVFWIGFE